MGEAHQGLLAMQPLAHLGDGDRSKIEKAFTEKSVARRRVLYRAGEPAPGLWFILSGFVKLVRSSPEGKELLMSLAGPGDMFGPCCDPMAASPAACTASTQSAARFLHLPFASWKTIRQSEPALLGPLLTVLLASRRGCMDLGSQLAFKPVEARLASLLHSMTRWSTDGPGAVELPPLLTQSEMANAVGTAREVVTRCLGRFEEQGLIVRRGRRIVLPDRAALAAQAG